MNPPGQASAPSPRGRWEIPFVTALLAATFWTACFLLPQVWSLTGIGQGDKPFLDLRNLISAGESQQLGFDPHVKNPRDPYNRPHAYSDWWLVLDDLGVDQTDTAWIGAMLLAVTLGAAVWVVGPATVREGAGLLLVLASPPLLMAVHRANHDLVVFILMCVALGCFRAERGPVRALGVALLAVAAVLKYFPLAAVVILLEARCRRELLGWIVVYALVLLLAWPSLERGFQTAVTHTPMPFWLYAYGAPVVFRNFELSSAPALGWMLAGAMLVAGAALWRPRASAPATEWATPDRDFTCGAVMVVGCFLHGSSFIYKLLFALWLLRGLWTKAGNGTEDRWRKATGWLLFAVLWFEGLAAVLLNLGIFPSPLDLSLLKACLFVEQVLTWALVACLWRYLVVYLDRHGRRWLGLQQA